MPPVIMSPSLRTTPGSASTSTAAGCKPGGAAARSSAVAAARRGVSRMHRSVRLCSAFMMMHTLDATDASSASAAALAPGRRPAARRVMCHRMSTACSSSKRKPSRGGTTSAAVGVGRTMKSMSRTSRRQCWKMRMHTLVMSRASTASMAAPPGPPAYSSCCNTTTRPLAAKKSPRHTVPVAPSMTRAATACNEYNARHASPAATVPADLAVVGVAAVAAAAVGVAVGVGVGVTPPPPPPPPLAAAAEADDSTPSQSTTLGFVSAWSSAGEVGRLMRKRHTWSRRRAAWRSGALNAVNSRLYSASVSSSVRHTLSSVAGISKLAPVNPNPKSGPLKVMAIWLAGRPATSAPPPPALAPALVPALVLAAAAAAAAAPPAAPPPPPPAVAAAPPLGGVAPPAVEVAAAASPRAAADTSPHRERCGWQYAGWRRTISSGVVRTPPELLAAAISATMFSVRRFTARASTSRQRLTMLAAASPSARPPPSAARRPASTARRSAANRARTSGCSCMFGKRERNSVTVTYRATV